MAILDHYGALENVPCNICGNTNNQRVLKVSDCVETTVHYQIVQCQKCGLAFVNPRPQNIDMRKYYPDDTYYAYQNNSLKGYVPKLRQKLKTYLMERMGGYKPQRHPLVKGGIIDRLLGKVMANHLIGVVPSKYVGKMLDVGCGGGDSLIWYQNHGWEAMGIEASKKGAVAAKLRGLEIIESTLEDSLLPDKHFDAITLVQVLEHLKDPKGALSKLYRALRPAGLIVAGVPNFLCLDRQLLGSAWLPLETPRHLYLFTPKSLQNLFKAVGFNVLEIRRKTKYGITLSQIKQSCRLNSGFRRSGNIAYILTSPLIKLLAPKDYSSTFISIFATK